MKKHTSEPLEGVGRKNDLGWVARGEREGGLHITIIFRGSKCVEADQAMAVVKG